MKNVPLYLMLLIVCFSCVKKEPASSSKLDAIDVKKSAPLLSDGDPSDILAFYSFIESPSNGIFGIKSYEPFMIYKRPTRPPVDNAFIDFGGAFYDVYNNIIPGGSITFGPMIFNSDPKHNYFYDMSTRVISKPPGSKPGIQDAIPLSVPYALVSGTTQNISINPVSGSSNLPNRGVDGTLYFPIAMKINHTNMNSETRNGNTLFKIGNFFDRDLDIYWNADTQNDKGVVIIMEYDADLSSSIFLTSLPANKKYYNAIRVPDNGHYTLNISDVQGLADDPTKSYEALIVVTIGRANYATLKDRDGVSRYSIYAATATDILLHMSIWRYIHN